MVSGVLARFFFLKLCVEAELFAILLFFVCFNCIITNILNSAFEM